MSTLFKTITFLIIFTNLSFAQSDESQTFYFERYSSDEDLYECFNFKSSTVKTPGKTIYEMVNLGIIKEKKNLKEYKFNFKKKQYLLDGSDEKLSNFNKVDSYISVKYEKLKNGKKGYNITIKYSNKSKNTVKFSYDPESGIFYTFGSCDNNKGQIDVQTKTEKNMTFKSIAMLASIHNRISLFLCPTMCKKMRQNVVNSLKEQGIHIELPAPNIFLTD